MTVREGRWFHYGCDHSAAGIKRLGLVHPNPHPLLEWASLAWLTDLDTPDRDGLGLTSDTLSCDRTAWRVTVEGPAWWWPEWARLHRISREVRDALETYGRPAHWWVSEEPLRVVCIDAMDQCGGPVVTPDPAAHRCRSWVFNPYNRALRITCREPKHHDGAHRGRGYRGVYEWTYWPTNSGPVLVEESNGAPESA